MKIELLTDLPVGEGTRFKETRIMFKREATEEMEFVEFDAPNVYTLGSYSCGCEFRMDTDLWIEGTIPNSRLR